MLRNEVPLYYFSLKIITRNLGSDSAVSHTMLCDQLEILRVKQIDVMGKQAFVHFSGRPAARTFSFLNQPADFLVRSHALYSGLLIQNGIPLVVTFQISSLIVLESFK